MENESQENQKNPYNQSYQSETQTVRYQSSNTTYGIGYDPLQREENADTHLYCRLERTITQNKAILLQGLTTIKSPCEVAFLFRNLEDACTEHSFVVLHQANDEHKILYLSTGATNGTLVDIKLIMNAVLEFKAKSITFVHNHPSGTLSPSQSDKIVHKNIKDMLPETCLLNSSIIINLDSGQFCLFNDTGYVTQKNYSHKVLENNTNPVIEHPVYHFDKRLLYDKTPPLVLNSPAATAAYLSTIKRGIHNKYIVLILDNGCRLNYAFLALEKDLQNIFGIVGKYGERFILAGNQLLSNKEIVNMLLNKPVAMEDFVLVEQHPDILENYKTHVIKHIAPDKDYLYHSSVIKEDEPSSRTPKPKRGIKF